MTSGENDSLRFAFCIARCGLFTNHSFNELCHELNAIASPAIAEGMFARGNVAVVARVCVSGVRAQRQCSPDAHLAVRDAFKAMRRKLEDYVRETRGDVKAHAGLPHGKVSELFPLEDYGFIKTQDGRRIYFHRNSVLDSRFDELDLETEVSFVEESGNKGPQASTVRPAGRHHHVIDQ